MNAPRRVMWSQILKIVPLLRNTAQYSTVQYSNGITIIANTLPQQRLCAVGWKRSGIGILFRRGPTR